MRKLTQSYWIEVQQIIFNITNLSCEKLWCLRYLCAFPVPFFSENATLYSFAYFYPLNSLFLSIRQWIQGHFSEILANIDKILATIVEILANMDKILATIVEILANMDEILATIAEILANMTKS